MAGNSLQLVDYDGSETSVTWTEGHRYCIADCNVQPSRGHDEIVLSPSKKTQIEHLDEPESVTRILVVGDTHVGYRHRPRHKKSSGSYTVDNRETFRQALRRARNTDVDAVIHAGDVFDHNTSQSDLDTVHEEVTRTCEQEIPFYFIRGNHDETSGRQLLHRLTAEQSKCCRLTTEETFIHGEGPSAITYGYDNSGGQLPQLSPDHYLRTLPMPDLLVIHDTPYPVVDEQGKNIYTSEELDLQDFLAESTLRPDFIISGHMHVGSKGMVRDRNVPVLTTGPTAPINSSTEDNEPSTWLLSISGTTPEIDRQPL